MLSPSRTRSLGMGLLLAAALLTLAACGSGKQPTATPLTSIRLSLGYIPDVQFAPFYVGVEKGFFAAQGIELTMEHRQETDGATLVATDEIQFAVVSGEQILLGREQGMPLVYVFEWYQKFPVAIASKAEKGIVAPADLAGHSVGTPVTHGASYIGLEALLASAGLSDADIDLQTTGYAQVETLVADRVDAVVVYAANEPAQLEAQGVAVNLIDVSDYADLVSNGLVTNEQTITGKPDLVRGMVAALAESVQYTIDHPDEAFEISKGFVEGLKDPNNEATAREVLTRSIALWQANRLGESDRDSWAAMQEVLIGAGLLTGQLDLEQVFTNDFLP